MRENKLMCAFLQNMRNMLRSHDRYKPVFPNYCHISQRESTCLWWSRSILFSI